MRDGVALLTWQTDTFAYAESLDAAAGRYRGLRGGQLVNLAQDSAGLLVKPDVARAQLNAELAAQAQPPGSTTDAGGAVGTGSSTGVTATPPPLPTTTSRPARKLKRFHGTVRLDPARVGRDASRIAEEVIAHLAGLVGAEVNVTIEIDAKMPDGTPDNVVRTVTENSRTLKFTSQGFEDE
jgi:hypothetical protein